MAKVGQVTENGQIVESNTGRASVSHGNQRIWQIRCSHCHNVYGANGCDIHIRKCPRCQGGRASEPLV